MKRKNENIMERTRAAVGLCNGTRDKELEIEAFMGLFHPQKQKDRRYMRKLKRAMDI